MSVSLSLTSRQVPIFERIMKNKVKVDIVNQTVEIDEANYHRIADVVATEWFRMAMENDADESLMLGIVQSLSPIAKYFPDAPSEKLDTIPATPPVFEAEKPSKTSNGK
jgi:hypothetical protein